MNQIIFSDIDGVARLKLAFVKGDGIYYVRLVSEVSSFSINHLFDAAEEDIVNFKQFFRNRSLLDTKDHLFSSTNGCFKLRLNADLYGHINYCCFVQTKDSNNHAILSFVSDQTFFSELTHTIDVMQAKDMALPFDDTEFYPPYLSVICSNDEANVFLRTTFATYSHTLQVIPELGENSKFLKEYEAFSNAASSVCKFAPACSLFSAILTKVEGKIYLVVDMADNCPSQNEAHLETEIENLKVRGTEKSRGPS